MRLEIKNISKTYGTNKALDDFSATLEQGIYALLGPNGSGKSTLMNIITDNLKADSGEILYADDDGVAQSIADKSIAFREKIGFMPQYPEMYPNFTAEQFLQYMAMLKDVGRQLSRQDRHFLINKQISDVLDELELTDVAKKKISTFSGGMKQRLALAQSVLGEPKILILDEPTAGLDPKQRIAVRNYISQIAFNKIVIIATHVVSDIEFIAKDIILLKKGKIVDMASPQKLLYKINGQVWEVCVAEDAIAQMQSIFSIINISRDEEHIGKVKLRMLSEYKPCDDAKYLSPTLEDYYLKIFGK